MKFIKKVCLGVILLIGLMFYFIYTNSGLHLLISSVSKLVPGLEITSVMGSWSDLTIKCLRYKMPGIKVGAGEFHIALNFGCLFQRHLCVNNLTLHNIIVDVNSNELKYLASKISESRYFSTPYPIYLRHLSLFNVQIKLDNNRVIFDKFSTGFKLQGNNLTVTPTRIYNLLVVTTTATEKLISDNVTSASYANMIKSNIGSLVEKQKILTKEVVKEELLLLSSLANSLRTIFHKSLLSMLPSFTMPFNLTLMGINGENLYITSGDSNIFITRLLLQATIHNKHADLTLLDIESQDVLINIYGHANFDKNWPISMIVKTTFNNELLKREKLKINIKGNLQDDLHAALNITGPVTAKLALKVQLSKVGFPLTLTLNSKYLQWPLAGMSQYQARSVALHLYSKASNYWLSIKATLSSKLIQPMNMTIITKGNTNGFILSCLRLADINGNTKLIAVLKWIQKDISLSSKRSLSIINQFCQLAKFPFEKEKINRYCRMYYDRWQLIHMPKLYFHDQNYQHLLISNKLLRKNIIWQWRKYKRLLSTSRYQFMEKNKFFNNISFIDNFINVHKFNSTISDGIDYRTIENINFRGNIPSHKLLININAYALSWGNTSISRIKLDGDVSFNDIINGDIHLQLYHLKHKGIISIEKLTINATGNENQHQLNIFMHGNPVNAQVQIKGSFKRDKKLWQGIMSKTSFDTPIGKWLLNRTVKLNYLLTTNNLVIGPHCWQNSNAQICTINNTNIGSSGQFSMIINYFDLAMLKPLLLDTQVSGIFTGRADIKWTADGYLSHSKISLVGIGVQVYQTLLGKTIPLKFKNMMFNASLDKDITCLDGLIKITDNGQVNSKIKIVTTDNNQKLSGNININNLSLVLFKPLLSQYENIDGLVNAKFIISGNMQVPKLFVNLDLDNLIVQSNFVPFVMTDSRIGLSLAGAKSEIQGFIANTHGKLNLIGNAYWNRKESWHVCITAKSNDMSIIFPPIVLLNMSPNISLEFMPTLFTIDGKINIPWGSIELKNMPQSATIVSSDEVILDEKLQIVRGDNVRSTTIPIKSNLLVHIGPNVNINAFGMKARLLGDLRILQYKEVLGLNGQIDIYSGRFNAYGQDLIVNKGQLLFSGPIDQHYINIEAIRNPASTEDDITAGIRITGSIDEPKVEIFSVPIKSQQEALSYLLRGQGLNSSVTDSSMMTSTLINIGIAQSWKFIGKIGQVFGVNDLALDTQGVGNKSQVVVSGYIAPGLQVKYGIGIFNSLATLTLRYSLTPKLYLEAISGLNNALYLLYKFDF